MQAMQVNFRMAFLMDRACGHGEMGAGTQFTCFTVAKVQNTDAEGAICVRFEGLFVRDVPVEGILKPKDVREVDVWEDEEAQAEHMRAQAISCTSPRVAADEVCVKRQPLSLITTDAVPNLLLT